MDALQTVCSTWTKDMKAWFREMKAWFRNMKAWFRNMKAWFRDMKDWLLGIAENCCLILYCLQCLPAHKKMFLDIYFVALCDQSARIVEK
jgi:hypothetical protein